MTEEEQKRRKRDDEIAREVRKCIAYELELDLKGGESIMKEVWEQCDDEGDIAAAKQELAAIVKALNRKEHESPIHAVVSGWDLFQSGMKLLIGYADLAAAKNYIEMTMVGLPAPFDRAAIHLLREHGRTPRECAENNKLIANRALDSLRNLAKCVTDRSHFEAQQASKGVGEWVVEERNKLV